MKIIHFSDLYLGYKEDNSLDEDLLEEREEDFYKVFFLIIEEIKRIRPDYIIYTGNLFYTDKPTNKSIYIVLKAFKEINTFNIPFILLAGDKNYNVNNLNFPIVKSLEIFDNICVCYNSYNKFEYSNVVFHCYPCKEIIYSSQILKVKLEQNLNQNKKNILLLSGIVSSEYNTTPYSYRFDILPDSKFLQKLDYVGLGGYHSFSKVTNYHNVYYSGSTERIEFEDISPKGFILATIENELYVEFKEINIRAKYYFSVDFENYGKDISCLEVPNNFRESIIHVNITNLTMERVRSNQYFKICDDIAELYEGAFKIDIGTEYKKNSYESIDDIDSLVQEEIEDISNKNDKSPISVFDSFNKRIEEIHLSLELKTLEEKIKLLEKQQLEQLEKEYLSEDK